ncbi:alanine racemase [Streptococcus sp. zg-JUN1979]|uniref:alanine racemase n=1 Tax=Streptococcus sp. zg-JUN1979 TaxID=3391450 RepID=UPI0039A71080
MISSIHRPTVAQVDLTAIVANLEAVRSHLPEDKQIFAVVKANAYGHGAVRVAKTLSDQADGFCVSNIDEALELREAGIDKPILILGVVMPEELALALAHDLIITVASQEWLDLALETAQSIEGLRCHIKVDSGMGRIGFRTSQEANQAIKTLRSLGALVEGIFTHFATADEADTTYFNQQLTAFKKLLSELDDCPKLVHASNSATSLWHSESVFNAVRLGLVLYGLNPSNTALELPYPLKPALCLMSSLVHVKCVERGDHVGYGATYESCETEWIGTIPIGYADGWTRDMQGFRVLVDGVFCDIVGRVSMDQITIRLPKKYPLGTVVTLIGDGICATDVATWRGTINYEVVCLLSDRIPRIYKGE